MRFTFEEMFDNAKSAILAYQPREAYLGVCEIPVNRWTANDYGHRMRWHRMVVVGVVRSSKTVSFERGLIRALRSWLHMWTPVRLTNKGQGGEHVGRAPKFHYVYVCVGF